MLQVKDINNYLFTENFCEELARLHSFPTGTCGYKAEREIPLSAVKYFDQRLFNHTQKYAYDLDYILFAHSVSQQLNNINIQINIAMHNVKSNNLTADMLTQNLKETVDQFITSDEAFGIINSIKGTPAYWKKYLHEVLPMFKQLGLPRLF